MSLEDNNIKDYYNELKSINEDVERRKKATASLIDEIGDELVEEIEKKHEEREEERLKMVKYIYKKTKEGTGEFNRKELDILPYEEVKSIYNKVKSSRKRGFRMLLDFIMGW